MQTSTSVRTKANSFARFIFCFALVLLTASALFGQSAGFGSISGVVQDPTGAVIAGAKVVVENPSKGIRRDMESTSGGTFTAPALVPATGYQIAISKEGFGKYEIKGITVNVGETVTVSPVLKVSSSASEVVVTAEAPTVDQTKTNVSTVIGSQQLLELPINGRRVDAFVLLSPGVTNDAAFGLLSFRGNPGGNSFLTDGNDTTNSFYDENAGRTRAYNISQDAVQEFQVVSANFSAEYGKASGGVVNTVTRSGTNSYHGSAYEFFRNRTLNATDRTTGGVNPQDWRHQAGLSVGGPIKKDKLFFFFNGEVTRRNNPIVSTNWNNNLYDAAGNWKGANVTSGTNAANCNYSSPIVISQSNPTTTITLPAPTLAQCQAAETYLASRVANQLIPRTTDANLLFGKIDWRPSEKHSFSFSSNYVDFRSPNGIQTQLSLTGGNGIGNNGNTTVFNRTGRASWTWLVSNRAVNEFRFGYFKDRQYDPAADTLRPSIGPYGLTVNGVSNVGFATSYPRLNPSEQRFQIADTYSWNVAKHNVKFGFDWDRVEDYVDTLSNRYGSFTYASLSAFAADFSANPNPTVNRYWQTYTQAFGNSIVDVKMPELSLFLQDEWRLTPKLTITPGIRFEHSWIPQPKSFNSEIPETGRIPNSGPNFAPRLGINYALYEKTTIRAGFGMFYNRFTTSAVENLFVSNGLYTQSNTLNNNQAAQYPLGPAFGHNLCPGDGPAGTPSCPPPALGKGTASVLFADKNYQNPYSMQGNLGLEREVAKNTTLSVDYIWSRSLHIQGSVDKNLKPLSSTCVEQVNGGYDAVNSCYTYKVLKADGTQDFLYTTPIYTTASKGAYDPVIGPKYNRISALQSNNNSYYNALLVNVSRRIGKVVTGNVAYTWSHTIDYNIGGAGSNILFGSFTPATYNNGDFRGEKGSASTDRRHNLAINVVLTPTFTQSNSMFARYAVNNWQLSVLTIAASSGGMTPFISTSSRPSQLLNSSINGFGGSSRVPWLPINSLDVGSLYKTDARITKVLPITERVKANLIFEGFNVFNHLIVSGGTPRNAQYYQSVNVGTSSAPIYALKPTLDQYGGILATQAPPDGTTARRLQAAIRITF